MLPSEWKPEKRVWGHFYQIYHYCGNGPPWPIDEAALCWQDPERRELAFEDVSIVELDQHGEVLACLDAVFACSNSIEDPWTWNREVSWIRPGEQPRSTSMGDVIVPALGDSWMVDRAGFRRLLSVSLQSDAHDTHPEEEGLPETAADTGLREEAIQGISVQVFQRIRSALARWQKGEIFFKRFR